MLQKEELKKQVVLRQRKRREVFEKLDNNSIAVFHSGYTVFMSADDTYPFVVNNNFYYLTGLDEENIILTIAKFDNQYYENLFIDENDELLVKWVGAKYTKEEASEISGVELKDIMYQSEFTTFMNNHLQMLRYSKGVAENIYLDLERRDLPNYTTFALEYAKMLKEDFPSVNIKNIYQMIITLRMVKDELEIALMKESIETTRLAIYNVMNHHDELKNEAIANAYYNFELDKVDKIVSFGSIMAAGMNGTVLHYRKNNSAIATDDLLLMDVGVYTKHYASDITRTIPTSGKFTPRQKEVYEVVLDCNKKCCLYAKAGMTWKELNDYAKNILAQGLKKLGIIKEDAELSKYYFHSIGHSLGLDVHDPCFQPLGLKEGMVITIEPGLYIPEEKIGIRIEDDILITKGEAIVLSKDIVKEIDDIEKMMN